MVRCNNTSGPKKKKTFLAFSHRVAIQNWHFIPCVLRCQRLELCFVETDQIDHDVYHPDPSLPFLGAAQDLYSTGSTLEMCPRLCRLYGSRPATWAGSYRSYRLGIYLPWQIYIMKRKSMLRPKCETLTFCAECRGPMCIHAHVMPLMASPSSRGGEGRRGATEVVFPLR